jgi:nitrogen-specific signal transduction histidine kinase
VFYVDKSWKVIGLNTAAEVLFGSSKAQLINSSLDLLVIEKKLFNNICFNLPRENSTNK